MAASKSRSTGGRLHVGQGVTLHYRSALVHGTITKVIDPGTSPANAAYMVHETHTTAAGRKLVHDKKHYGRALRAS